MKVLHIAHQDNIGFSVPDFVHAPIPTKTRLEDWARLYHDEWESADIFIIDAFFSPFDDDCLKPDGIKLLKILRLLGYKQHCIIYSFYSLEEMLFDYQYTSILKSKGTTYLRVPCVIDEALCEAKISVSCEEDMVPFFKAEAIEWMGTKRHSLANWWGVLRVFDLLKQSGLIGEDIPDQMKATLRRDSSYEGLLMNFFRFGGVPPIFSIGQDIANTINERLRVLWKRDLKVVYVDDCADDGWSFLLQILLYGRVSPELFKTPSIPHEDFDANSLAKIIVEEHPDLIILDIRLTLEDEQAVTESLSGIVLTRLLVNKYSNTCPILILTASDKRAVSEEAHNAGADAVWTKEGVDEGRHHTFEKYRDFSVSRFFELVMQVRRLTGFDFTLLYDGLKHIHLLESSQELFWWQKEKWFVGDSKQRKPIEKSLIINELKKLYISHKQFLSATQKSVKNSVYDMLTIKLCRIMEILHPKGNSDDTGIVSLGKAVNEDWPAYSIAATYAGYLIATRNEVVHYNSMFDIQRNDVLRYKITLNAFFNYLTLPDPAFVPGKEMGILSRRADGTGQVEYYFRSPFYLGRYNSTKDIRQCERLLNDDDTISGIETRLLQPIIDYDLGEVCLAESFAEAFSDYWTASFSVLQTSSWDVILSLYDISPRQGIHFRVRVQSIASQLQMGDRLFFYIKWKDLPNEKPTCSIYNVQLSPIETMKHTFWSGIVSRVFQTERGTFVMLKSIEPPFNARFKASASFVSDSPEISSTSRIGFRPNLLQKWVVMNPVQRVSNESQ